jgi:hypothetical protein
MFFQIAMWRWATIGKGHEGNGTCIFQRGGNLAPQVDQIPFGNLRVLEARLRERVVALEQNAASRAKGASSDYPSKFRIGTGTCTQLLESRAPLHFSAEMTWKDKIIQVVQEAKRPLLAGEVGPVLLQ